MREGNALKREKWQGRKGNLDAKPDPWGLGEETENHCLFGYALSLGLCSTYQLPHLQSVLLTPLTKVNILQNPDSEWQKLEIKCVCIPPGWLQTSNRMHLRPLSAEQQKFAPVVLHV